MLPDFLGDHFLFGCRDGQARQQPQLAGLFRSEVAKLTTRLPDFPYSCWGPKHRISCPVCPWEV